MHDGQQQTLIHAVTGNGSNIAAQIRPMFDEPVHTTLEAWKAGEHIKIELSHGEQWNQAHQGSNAQRNLFAVGKPQPVVIESFLFIPQTTFAQPVHGARDIKKMLEEV